MATHAQPIYRYCVDENDVVTSVDQWWLAFAQENNASGLTESNILGRSLWDFISDDPTRTLYREIHAHVRSTGSPISIPLRCDSPTLQRFMELTISTPRDRQLLYECALIRAVPQRRLAVLDPEQKRSVGFLIMCSFCKRCLIEPAAWLELENIALKLRLYDGQTVPELIFTVCPTCEDTARRRVSQSDQSFD